MSRVAIIATGDELLNGITMDTNSYWLVSRLVELGCVVTRTVTVPDDHDQIIEELTHALNNDNRLVITMGGLGPSFDDQTLAAVAEFVGVDLVKNEEALRMVKTHYHQLYDAGVATSDELTAERAKMAVVPVGCDLLSQTVGAAPGVLLKNVRGSGMDVVSLPGVPAEMKEIFSSSLMRHLVRLVKANELYENTLVVDLHDESEIAAVGAAFKDANRDLYVKSHTVAYEGMGRVALTFGIRADDSEDPVSRINSATNVARQLLSEAGIGVLGEGAVKSFGSAHGGV